MEGSAAWPEGDGHLDGAYLEVLHACIRGEGMDVLAGMVGRALGGLPVMIFDFSFQLFGSYAEGFVHESFDDAVRLGYLDFSGHIAEESKRYLSVMRRSGSEPVLFEIEGLPYPYLSCAVHVGGLPVGILHVIMRGRTAGETEYAMVGAYAELLSIPFQRLDSAKGNTGVLEAQFLLDLLEREMDGREADARARSLGIVPNGPFRMLCLHPADGFRNQSQLSALRDSLMLRSGLLRGIVFGDAILCLVSDGWEQDLSYLLRWLGENRMQASVSGPGAALSDAKLLLVQCDEARRLSRGGAVARFEDYQLDALVSRIAGIDGVEGYLSEGIRALIAHDEAHGTEYLRTLRTFYGCGRNQQATASELSIHRTTLRYRLTRIGEIVGCPPDSEDSAFHLELSLRVAEVLDPPRG